MSYQLRVRPQVESDIEAAALWYEERQPGLGAEFVHEVRQAMTLLTLNPLIYPIRHRRYHRAVDVSQPLPLSNRLPG